MKSKEIKFMFDGYQASYKNKYISIDFGNKATLKEMLENYEKFRKKVFKNITLIIYSEKRIIIRDDDGILEVTKASLLKKDIKELESYFKKTNKKMKIRSWNKKTIILDGEKTEINHS